MTIDIRIKVKISHRAMSVLLTLIHVLIELTK
jgi:hypothetical protein